MSDEKRMAETSVDNPATPDAAPPAEARPATPAPPAASPAPPPGAPRSRVPRILAMVAADVGWPLVWAALVVAIVLFSGVVSQFAYVDF